MPRATQLPFCFALFSNGPHESDGVASQKTTKPRWISPVDSHFQGNSGSAARMASGWKGKTVWAWAHTAERRAQCLFSLWALPLLHVPCFNNTGDQPDRNQGVWKRKKTVPTEPRNTRGREKAAGIKCEVGKALGSNQISWKMGRRATVAWVGIYDPLLCSAQTTAFSEHWERIIIHLYYSCSDVYSTRWKICI